jgi:hypothetical protein
MKRLALLSTVLFLTAGVAFAVESGSVPTSEIPEVKQVTGKGDQVLETSYYPMFEVESGDYDEECLTMLKKLENKTITTKIDGRGARHHWYDIDGDGEPGDHEFINDAIAIKPIPLEDLEQTVKILPAHRKTAKILVFWTVRVVGQCLPLLITGDICDYYNAETKFTCKANDVKTYVSINGVLKDKNPCTLQIPEMTGGSDESAMYDPTITGTYVISRDDFPAASGRPQDNAFPDQVNIKIYWQNSGSMRVTSPDGMRNMIVNVIPYSRSDKQ